MKRDDDHDDGGDDNDATRFDALRIHSLLFDSSFDVLCALYL